ncbi:hypothetical protein AZOA_45430 [Azoarcus sp. Aa7]|nr:hypothetical protein [Azoarcus sp. Aa7]
MSISLTKTAQRERVLTLLRKGPVSTSELRENHACWRAMKTTQF